jgi:hypothetical protein
MTPYKQSLAPCPYCGPICEVGVGLCHCGCGKTTNTAPQAIKKLGMTKGQPYKFVLGHLKSWITKPRDPIVRDTLDGADVLYIPLTKGFKAIIDASCEPLVQGFWYEDSGYAVQMKRADDGTQQKVWMHNLICKAPDGMEVDHENRNRLDNRTANLRPATRDNNAKNRSVGKNNTSGVPGVSWHKLHQRWVVRININKVRVILGEFVLFEKAVEIRLEAEELYYGEFRRKAA